MSASHESRATAVDHTGGGLLQISRQFALDVLHRKNEDAGEDEDIDEESGDESSEGEKPEHEMDFQYTINPPQTPPSDDDEVFRTAVDNALETVEEEGVAWVISRLEAGR